MADESPEDRAHQIARDHGFLRPDGSFIWVARENESPGREDPEPVLERPAVAQANDDRW